MRYIISALIAFGFAGSANAAGIKVGDKAPCITINTKDAAGVTTATSTCQSNPSGKKLVLDFFATWCRYCVSNLPVFENLAKNHHDAAEFRIVGLDDQAAPLDAFFKARNTSSYKVMYDMKSESADAFGIEGTPTTVVIGKDGKVELIHVGTMETAQEIKEVEDAIVR